MLSTKASPFRNNGSLATAGEAEVLIDLERDTDEGKAERLWPLLVSTAGLESTAASTVRFLDERELDFDGVLRDNGVDLLDNRVDLSLFVPDSIKVTSGIVDCLAGVFRSFETYSNLSASPFRTHADTNSKHFDGFFSPL